jgi:hypothetical protein
MRVRALIRGGKKEGEERGEEGQARGSDAALARPDEGASSKGGGNKAEAGKGVRPCEVQAQLPDEGVVLIGHRNGGGLA